MPPAPGVDVRVEVTPGGAGSGGVVVEQDQDGATVRADDVTSSAEISTSALALNGLLLFNQSPGSLNNQSNALALAFGEDVGGGVLAQAQADASQRIEAAQVDVQGGSFDSTVGPGAFADTAGIVAVNQASGVLANQSNAMAISIGEVVPASLADATLGQLNSANVVTLTGSKHRDVVEDGAFDRFTGVVQLNQSSGVANNQANAIALGIDVGFSLANFLLAP